MHPLLPGVNLSVGELCASTCQPSAKHTEELTTNWLAVPRTLTSGQW
jgi:hypothetical protein